MSDYISRENLINDIENVLWDWNTLDGITATTVLKQTITDIKNQPKANVQEIKYGKWVRVEKDIKNDTYGIYECSLCGRKISCDRYPTKRVPGLDWPVAVTVEELFPYCHCGAKMQEHYNSPIETEFELNKKELCRLEKMLHNAFEENNGIITEDMYNELINKVKMTRRQ